MPPLLPAMSGRGAYWGPHPMPPDTQGSRINMRLALGFTHEKPEDESDTKPRNFGASLALRKRLFSNQAAWLSGGPSHQSDLMREPWHVSDVVGLLTAPCALDVIAEIESGPTGVC